MQIIRAEIQKHADPERAALLGRYFKTGTGEYGEGDRFYGIKVPALRKIALRFRTTPMKSVERLIRSPYHEERFVALAIWVYQYLRSDRDRRRGIYQAYVRSLKWINNWDLIDLSAPHILGGELTDGRRVPLRAWAISSNLWKRRLAMMATFGPIRRGDFADALYIARILVADREDLIQKAVGWMLREIGKMDVGVEEEFLSQFGRSMPRTMLRYAIERFPERKRRRYLRLDR